MSARTTGIAARLGALAHELVRTRRGLLAVAGVALLATVVVNFSVSLAPPHVEWRTPQLASASTQVLVDSPRSTLVDLREDSYGMDALSRRAVVMGTLLASPSVRDHIAQRAGIDPALLRTTSPATPEQPRAVAVPGSQPRVSDLLRSADGYSLSFRVTPNVPILDVYAEAPSVGEAERLADAAMTGLADYLDEVAEREGTDPASRVELRQLGEASGGLVNRGANIRWAVLTFAISFALAAAVAIFVSRARRGWRSTAVAPPAGGAA
ncbi:MAG TPA: hypothetical protein VIL04_09195 [Solirubrobacterales bacterium]